MNDHDETRPVTSELPAVDSPSTTPPDVAPVAADAPRGPAAVVTADVRARRPPTRVRTVVLGLVFLAVSVLSLLALYTDVHVDGGAVFLGIVVVAGLMLVGGGIAGAVREAHTSQGG